jgi:hypothetical protein
LQNLSAYDFFIGRDASTPRRYHYTPGFEALLLEMPRVLAAFDTHWGDARTNLTTYLQLQLQMDRDDDKADGVLNGPTTEAWFDHWYRHLVELDVRFVRSGVERIEAPPVDRAVPPHRRQRVQVQLTNGIGLAADYVVVAVDAPAAERITAPLRAAGTGGTVAGLDGFTTSVPPAGGPLHPEAARSSARRDPYALDQMGRVPWDRFQTLAGIQYFFDTEFQLLRGHMYYSGTEWGLSSINQSGMWERQRTLAHDGHISVLSVDIGDFNTPSRHLVDGSGRGKAARDCTPDELAQEVWRQIVHAVTSDAESPPEALLPWPAWYALDRNLQISGSPSNGRLVRNDAPYLVPIVGDWPNRPGCDPWNPHGSSWTTRPTEACWLENLEQRSVWQARHGGSQVHHNSVVFAGTWNKTFTRMTSMEAACESARHAVNAVLDHYVWVESGGVDRRDKTTLDWRLPFGFLDQGFSSPIRLPTPAGDYCYVFDVENREPSETRNLRNLDSQYCLASLPHPLDPSAANSAGRPASPVPTIPGGQPMTSSPADYAQQLSGYLHAWRQYLEQTAGVTAPSQAAPWGAPPMPPAGPYGPPPLPTAAPSSAAGPPMDYTQQLLVYLQAWRQYLAHAMSVAAPGQCAPPTVWPPMMTPPPVAATPSPPCPPTPPNPSSPPNPPASQDESPSQTTVDPGPLNYELVSPRHGDYSQFTTHGHKDEPNPGTGSLYHPSRMVFAASPTVEQPTSAYVLQAETASPPAPVPQSLYRAAAAPTLPASAKPQRHEELEIIAPVANTSP